MRASDGAVRAPYGELAAWLEQTSPSSLSQRRREAELLFRRIGITFALDGENEGRERLIPFDVIPRILSAEEWDLLRRGLEQRVNAINVFLKDIYSRREILRAAIVPEELVFENPVFRPEMNWQKVPHDIYIHIAGIDIVRIGPDTFYVLRTTSARRRSAYMLENREIMLRLFPELLAPAPGRTGRELYPDDLLTYAVARSRPAQRRADHSSPPADFRTRPITSTSSWPTNWRRAR